MEDKCEYERCGRTCNKDATHIGRFESPAGPEYGTFTKKYCEEHAEWARGCGNFIYMSKIEVITLQACPECNPKYKKHTLHKTIVDKKELHFTCQECNTQWIEVR